MNKQEQRKDLINQTLSQLVSSLMGPTLEEDFAINQKSMNLCIKKVHQHNFQPNDPVSVWETMEHFLDRFDYENLQELGDSFKMMAKIIIDDIECQEPLKWCLLEFMLSVNYRTFHVARIHFEEKMQLRIEILEALTVTYNTVQEQVLLRTIVPFDYEMPSDGLDSIHLSCQDLLFDGRFGQDLAQDVPQDSSQDSLQEWHMSARTELTRCSSSSQILEGTIKKQLSYDEALIHMQHAQLQYMTTIAKHVPYFSEPRSHSRFSTAYGDYLRCQHRDLDAVRCLGDEGHMLRELITMFFQPETCRYFVVTDENCIQLRSSEIFNMNWKSRQLEKFLEPLNNMQQMQLFIDCYEVSQPYGQVDRLETLVCFITGLRRLLKPVVESMTYFEQGFMTGPSKPTIHQFHGATKSGFQRLQLLWKVAECCSVFHPDQLELPQHSRSQYIVSSLYDLVTDSDAAVLRPYAAALLVHVLQINLMFLDNWWKLGNYHDYQNEFLGKCTEYNGRVEYKLQEVEEEVDDCPIYDIFGQHFVEASNAISFLFNGKRLPGFVALHHSLLKKSLHHSFIKELYHQLKPYQVEPFKKEPAAPDIFHQLRASYDEQMRDLFYSYYKETMPDLTQPRMYSVDELLIQCQSCAVYTPLDKIICLSLESVLQQRTLLVNSFVVHLFREELRLGHVFAQLRTLFLVDNFESYMPEYGVAFDHLQEDRINHATTQFKCILDIRNQSLKPPIPFEFYYADNGDIMLDYNCGKDLAVVITDEQLGVYNAALHYLLPLRVIIERLKQLEDLSCPALTESLRKLQEALLRKLEGYVKSWKIEAGADKCASDLASSTTLANLMEVHDSFLNCVAGNTVIQGPIFGLEFFYAISRVLHKIWNFFEVFLITVNHDEKPECPRHNRRLSKFFRQIDQLMMAIIPVIEEDID